MTAIETVFQSHAAVFSLAIGSGLLFAGLVIAVLDFLTARK